jgi:hypothetical protein
VAGERMAPVVSGPVVAGGVDGMRAERSGDVIDAEFETLKPDPAERLLPPRAATPIGTATAPAYGLDTLRKSYVRGSAQAATRGDPIFWTVGMFLVIAAFWISGGHALVSQSLIPAWHFTPANPLSIAGVTSRVEDRAGRAVLFVEGKALNAAVEEQPVPNIELRVTANDGSVMRYSFKASSGPLPGGSAVAFSSRLEAPKEGVRSVTVNFQD